MKFFINALFLGLALSFSVAQAQPPGNSQDGWPLPWPFPWAKECPMDWGSMNGVYKLAASAKYGRLVLHVTQAGGKNGLMLVHVSRVSSRGKLLYDGSTYVTPDQNVLSLYMQPQFAPDEPSIWAVIKMHYQSAVMSCDAADLVPILTVAPLDQDSGAPACKGIDFEMFKIRSTVK
jgi:hypothetical protein